LLDENCESKWLVGRLRQAGHDVACLKNLAAKGIADEKVLELATIHNRVLYTRDRDFVALSTRIESHNGIILEFVTDTPGDLTVQQIVDALGLIEAQYSSFCSQVIVINNFRTVY
jgi:predicted nuclease of predicted toxin-antitoxin system